MSIKLKDGRTWVDPFGIEHSDLHGEIKEIYIDDSDKKCEYTMDLFYNEIAANESKEPLGRYKYTIEGTAYDLSFGKGIMTNNIYLIAEMHILTNPVWMNWEYKP
jgi:hypothetical protein